MTSWQQAAVVFIFSSIALSGLVQIVNLMGPVPIIDV